MICVSIGRGRHKQMRAEHKHLVEQGAQLVELRLDYIRREVNLKRLLEDRPCPVIATCRRERDGGKWEGTEGARHILLRSAIVAGVEYVDLEEDIADLIPRYGTTKRIISYHNFRETPDDLHAIHERMMALDADIVKLSTMAHTPYDNVRMLKLSQESPIPTVAICMGEIGTPSRILAARFGAPFTYATFHHERTLAPGQLSYRQMRAIYDYDRINEKTEVYGVIADPVAHSLSPIIHNASFRAAKLNKVYVPFRVPRDDLAEFLVDCRQLGVKGLSVTIPHKEAVVDRLTQADPAVRDIGACNTILYRGQDLCGYNTDHTAALACLDDVTQFSENPHAYKGQKVLILGAGGVAKAIGYGLKQRQADVVISSRTFLKAKELADSLDCQAVEWEERREVKPKFLINGTPVGMHPNVDESPFDKKWLRRTMTVFDTVYNPEQTLLIKDARAHGCMAVITGVEMFIRQAAEQFKLFTGREAPTDLMLNKLKQAIGPIGQE